MFSPNEEKVIKIIGQKTMSIIDITEKFYDHEVVGANNLVGAIIRRINAKCRFNNLDWFLNGEGIGRGGRKIWKDKQ